MSKLMSSSFSESSWSRQDSISSLNSSPGVAISSQTDLNRFDASPRVVQCLGLPRDADSSGALGTLPRVVEGHTASRRSSAHAQLRRLLQQALGKPMASEIFALLRCKQCVRTADRHADVALIGFTEENEAREELGYPWVKWRRFLVAVLLWTMTLFVSLAYSLVGSFFPIEAAEMGSNSITTAIIIGASPLCLATLSPGIGYFLPKLGTKMILISGQVLVGGTFVLMAFLAYMPSATSFVVCGVLLRLTEGVGWAMCNTTTFALIPVLFPSRVGTLTGLIFGAIGLAYTIGPPLGSLLVVAAGYSAPFWIVGGLILCLPPVTFLLVKETSSSSKVLPLKMVIKLLSHLSFTMIQIADVVVYGSLTFQNTALGVYLMHEIGVNLVEVGIDFSVLSVVYALGTIVAGQLSDKFGSRIFIITGLFICGASLVILGLNTLFPIPRRWTIIIALVLLGCGTSLADVPTYSDLLQQAQTLYAKENQESLIAAVSGITAFSQAFGSFLGVLLSGILTYVTDFPTGNLMFGEAIIMHAFLVLGVSLIDYVFLKQRPLQY